jgi:hypothetical protein
MNPFVNGVMLCEQCIDHRLSDFDNKRPIRPIGIPSIDETRSAWFDLGVLTLESIYNNYTSVVINNKQVKVILRMPRVVRPTEQDGGEIRVLIDDEVCWRMVCNPIDCTLPPARMRHIALIRIHLALDKRFVPQGFRVVETVGSR